MAHCAAFVRNRKCKAILLSSALHVSKICRYTSDTWHTSNVASGILPRSSRDKGGSRLLRNNEYICNAISRIKCSNAVLKASYHERKTFCENLGQSVQLHSLPSTLLPIMYNYIGYPLLDHFSCNFNKCSNALYIKIDLVKRRNSMFYFCGQFLKTKFRQVCI